MSKDKKNGNSLTTRTNTDPYVAASRVGRSGIAGTRLKFIKGEWIVCYSCDDEDVIPNGSRFWADVPTTHMGFARWEDGVIVDAVIAHVGAGERVPDRRELGDLDKNNWPIAEDGRRKDPWSPDTRMRMVAVEPPHEPVTLTSSSWGGRFAIQDLLGDYGKQRPEHEPDEKPIVEVGGYMRPDKRYGKIPTPTFEFVGWATLDEVTNGLETKHKKQIETAKPASNPNKAKVKAKLAMAE